MALLTLLGKLSETETQTLQNYCCLALSDVGGKDISSYAPGRQRAWLFGEPDLRKDVIDLKVRISHYTGYFRKLSDRITDGKGHVGLVANGLIKPHRDHRYAAGPAWSITTKRCIFEIWERNTDLRDCKRGTGELHELQPGEITSFWSKNPHCVWEMEPNRFSVTFWTVRNEWLDLMF